MFLRTKNHENPFDYQLFPKQVFHFFLNKTFLEHILIVFSYFLTIVLKNKVLHIKFILKKIFGNIKNKLRTLQIHKHNFFSKKHQRTILQNYVFRTVFENIPKQFFLQDKKLFLRIIFKQALILRVPYVALPYVSL